MKNIIVVGYPKSGNTWVTRLVAELVGCPIAGFWHSDHNEIAGEGTNRQSDFRCFKSHHQLHELEIDNNSSDEYYIIYVIRDPRDVSISGANYFQFERYNQIYNLLKKLPKGRALFYRIIYKIIYPESFRISQMMNAVLYGSKDVHDWCRIPWNTHYKAYLESGYLFVRYEDLLSKPENECKKILAYLGLSRQENQIKEAIKNQSFEKKKEYFLQKGDNRNVRFMRTGTSEQWKRKLSKKQKEIFNQLLHEELMHLSYATSNDCVAKTKR